VLSAGVQFNCTVVAGGGVKCWGHNASGQLGDGTTADRYAAGFVTGLEAGAFTVSAGDNHACAVTVTGGVKCWGNNDHGQIGNDIVGIGETAQLPVSLPVDVVGLTSGVVAVSCGSEHTCALTIGGAVKCWGQGGSDSLGALGQDPFVLESSAVPVDVPGL
jgi:alpha-tubulin suppressor-like RCC1 family protein